MKVLAFDTAMMGCSVAVCDTEQESCLCEQQAMARGQAETLVPMVQDVIGKAGLSFAAVDLIATTVGPGAFTGLRIGISAAQAFALALDKPVAGLLTTDVLARMFFEKENLKKEQKLCVLIETKRKDFYCRFYGHDGAALGKPQALTAEQIKQQDGDVVYIGDALERFGIKDDPGYELPDPCVMARMAYTLYESGPLEPLVPVYLRDADVSQSKKTQRTILDQ